MKLFRLKVQRAWPETELDDIWRFLENVEGGQKVMGNPARSR